jgi:mannosylglycerate hydrolase
MVLEGPASLVAPAAEQIDWSSSNEAFSIATEDGRVLVANERRNRGQLVTPDIRAALAAIDEPGTLRLKVRRPASATVLAHVQDVPGFGWATWSPDDAGHPPTAVSVDGTTLSNGLVRVDVDRSDGTVALDGHGGLGRLVDGGDCGDTYNYCPPTDDTLVDRPDEASVETLESGPLRARLQVTARYRWPASTEGLDRRVGEVEHEVRTVIELRAGETAARVEVTVDNRSRDHRLRAHLPLPDPADRSRAECAFATVERGLEAEGGPTEVGLPTFPARRFVQAGGLTVVHDGVAEYELVDVRDGRAHELALTLLRCTGMLSQGPMATRPLPAGPLTPIEGPQLQKALTLRYAVAVGDVDPYALADDVLVPLVVARPVEATRGTDRPTEAPGTAGTDGGPDLPARGAALTVHGAEVSAVTRDGGTLAVRVFNPRPEPTTVTIEGRAGWLVDLRGRPQQPFEGSFDLRAWAIATAVLRP